MFPCQAMLVVTTMLTSLANDLPRSAGFKYIDIWLLFCLLIPVMEILLHTVEDHFNRRWVEYSKTYCDKIEYNVVHFVIMWFYGTLW